MRRKMRHMEGRPLSSKSTKSVQSWRQKKRSPRVERGRRAQQKNSQRQNKKARGQRSQLPDRRPWVYNGQPKIRRVARSGETPTQETQQTRERPPRRKRQTHRSSVITLFELDSANRQKPFLGSAKSNEIHPARKYAKQSFASRKTRNLPLT